VPSLLEVEAVETFYGSSQALFGITFDVRQGECVSLLGRNGMGKTTTVKTVMGLVAARRGWVRFEGAEIQTCASYQVAQRGIGLVPEGREIFPTLSVRENLVATAANRSSGPAQWTLDSIYAMFPRLAERGRLLAAMLSGGEQQMLAIGRALMTNPRLLILDEATEGLAPLVRREIWNCLARLKSAGLALVVIDKNIRSLLRLVDRHNVLERGRVVWTGSSEMLRKQPEILHRYVGV
jgi:branched-chain amino acid transport system ATP-binding protein